MTILDQLAEYAEERVKIAKEKIPLTEVRAQAESLVGAETDGKNYKGLV